jgi:hypothetical protein
MSEKLKSIFMIKRQTIDFISCNIDLSYLINYKLYKNLTV